MKSIAYVLMFPLALCFFCCALFADEKYTPNQSIEYLRTGSRNATTDIDGVFFNPAGLTKLKDGLHIYMANHFLFGEMSIKNDTQNMQLMDEYKGSSKIYVFPSSYSAFKIQSFTVFLGVSPVGGYGPGQFNSGVPYYHYIWKAEGRTITQIIDEKAKYSGMFITGSLGLAYAINDIFSVALSGKYYYAGIELNAYTQILDQTATQQD